MPLLQPVPAPPPLPPAVPVPVGALPGADAQARAEFLVGVPKTAQQLNGVRAQRRELQNQLESARSDRLAIAQLLRQGTAGGQDQAGLEARMRVLDDRIVRIENAL